VRAGLPISLIGHALAIAGGIIALPYVVETGDSEPVPVVPIDIVTIADETNIRAAVEDEEPEPEPEPALEEAEPEPEEPPAEQAEPLPPEPEPQAEETEPEAVDIPDEEPEAEPEPEPEPEPAPPQREERFSLDRIASLVDKAKEDERPRDERDDAGDAPPERAEQARRAAGLGSDLTVSEYDALRLRMQECWRAPLDAPDPESLKVSVRVQLNRDGTLAAPPQLLDRTRINLSGDRYLRLAGERAVRAVQQCAPYSFLPPEKYSAWREITMNFEADL